MSPELDSLLVWFLGFIRTGIFVYAGIAVIGALIILVLHISEMEIGKNFLKLFPMFFFPVIFKQLVKNTVPSIMQSQLIEVMKYVDLFYVIPILAFALMTVKEL